MDAARVMSSYEEFVQLKSLLESMYYINIIYYLPINPTLKFSGQPFFLTASGNSSSVYEYSGENGPLIRGSSWFKSIYEYYI